MYTKLFQNKPKPSCDPNFNQYQFIHKEWGEKCLTYKLRRHKESQMIGAKSHILSRAFRKKYPFTERLLYHLNETNSGESPAEMNLALLENR